MLNYRVSIAKSQLMQQRMTATTYQRERHFHTHTGTHILTYTHTHELLEELLCAAC